MLISYQDGTGTWRAKSSRGIKGSTDWTREEVTITLPADATSTSVIARVSLEGEQGKAYFDCLQVEDGSIMNRYNLVENPDFSYGLEFWTKNPDMASGDTIVTLNDASYPKHLEKNAFKVQGESTKSKNIYQTVFMNGKKGDVFVLGGWAKANSVPTDSNRAFRMDIGIQKTDGNWQWQNIHFNPDVSDWQYGLNSIQAAADYTSITVYLMYYNNENTAYFDGIQLYKEEFGSNYKYDSKGNLTGANNTGKNTSIKYTAQNDIESITDPRGNETRFTEYNKHNLKKSISPEGLTTGFAYDSYGNVLTQEITDTTSGKFIKSDKTYTADGDYLKEDKTAFGKTITYDYDANRGTLSSLTDEKGRNTYYNYDPITDNLLKVYKNVGGQEVSNSYAYENDRLKSITHNQFSYLFDYSPLGDVKNVKVGTQDLITNTYEDRTGKLLKSTYGNRQEISYVYDEADRVIENKFNGVTRYTYTYDAQGNVGRHEDLVNGVTYRYFTDVAGRNSQMRDSIGNITQWLFDENGNTTHLKENLIGVERNTDYFYDKDNKLTKVSYNNNNSKILYNYKGTTSNPENLGRLTDVTVHVDGENKYKTKYSYIDGTNGAKSTTGIVSSVALSKIIKVTNPLTNVIEEQEDEQKLLSYTYDDSGNIETITHPDGKIIRYYYDELNQLIREDNQIVNKTIDYTYDVGGNIQTKVESDYTTGEERNNSREYRYEYDTAWKDKLIEYDGKVFAYDAIGNIINDSEYAYTWEQGRQLASMQKAGQNIAFKYNAQGIRTEKTVNGVTTQYHLVGDQVTYETDGTDKVYYTYDSAGNLVSMNLNGIEYYYIYNAQGDIISLIDTIGNEVVSYTYDTWGKLLSIERTLKDTVDIKNPYRYRSYRYDIETGEQLSHNLFAYCDNDPINNLDSKGYWKIPNWVKVAIGAVSNGIGTVASGGSVQNALNSAGRGAVDGFMWGAIGVSISVIGAAAKGVKIINAGKLTPSNKDTGYYGIKYQAPKPNGKYTTKSFEFHTHNHKGYNPHWQQNTWNPYNNSISAKAKRWNWWGRRVE